MFQSTSNMEEEDPLTLEYLIQYAREVVLSSVPDLTPDDISSVWFQVSQIVAEKLMHGKGVSVPGLGVFTLTEERSSSGYYSEDPPTRTPVFLISDRFANRHDVHVVPVPRVEGNIPVIPLPLTHIAMNTALEKHEVEASIREILLAFVRHLDDPRGLALELYGIGELSVRKRKIRFNFFRGFLRNPKPVQGRPPTRSDLSSRCGTAAVLGRPSSQASERVPVPTQKYDGGEVWEINDDDTYDPLPPRGQTPVLFRTRNKPVHSKRKKIGWQSSLAGNTFVEIVDPENSSAGSLPYQKVGGKETRGRFASTLSRPIHETILEDVEAEHGEETQVDDHELELPKARETRNLNLTTDLERIVPRSDEITVNEKQMHWDTEAGTTLPRLDTTLQRPSTSAGNTARQSLYNPRASMTGTMSRPGTADATTATTPNTRYAQLARAHRTRPRREEVLLFDPHRPRFGCKQHRNQKHGLCYICYQQSRATPKLRDEQEEKEKEMQEEKKLLDTWKKETTKLVQIQRKLDQQKKKEKMRTAEFNWTVHQDKVQEQQEEAKRLNKPGGMYVMHTRPPTNRVRNRQVNTEVANDLAAAARERQDNLKYLERVEKEIDHHVRLVAEEQYRAQKIMQEAQQRRNNMEVKTMLDLQVQERRAREEQERKKSLEIDALDVPHFHPTLDEEGFQQTRYENAKQDLLRNTQALENMKLQEQQTKEQRIEEGRAMLKKAQAALKLEDEAKRKAKQLMTQRVQRALEAGRRAKELRDAEEQKHMKMPPKLNVLEQVDQYYDEQEDVPVFEETITIGRGRAPSIVDSAFIKGTGIIA